MPPRQRLAGQVGAAGSAGKAALGSLGFVAFTFCAQWLAQRSGGWQFQRAAFHGGAWWQLFTSQWVHLGYAHAAVNVAAMVLMLFTFDRLVPWRVQLAALVGAYIGVAAVIAWDPGCMYYAGASGALHGFFAGNAVALLVAPPASVPAAARMARAMAAMALIGLCIKLALQQGWMGPPNLPNVGNVAWLGFATYYPAHTAGAAGGLLAALLALAWMRNGQATAHKLPR